MKASEIRKGSKIVVESTVVRVSRREKWNKREVKLHFEDCGNGLAIVPIGAGKTIALKERFYQLDELLNVIEDE